MEKELSRNQKTLLKNTIMQYLMVVAQYVFPLVSFPYLTRILSTEAYGVHTYMTSVASYIQLFVDFGFILSSTEQIARSRNNKNIQKIFSDTILAKIILFVISILALSVAIPFQPILRNYKLISYLYMGTVFFSIFTSDFLFRGIEKMEVLTYRFIISKFVSTCMVFILIKKNDDLLWVPIINSIGSMVSVVVTWLYIYKELNIKFIYTSIKDAFIQIKKSYIYFISNVATTAFGAFTTIVMGFSLNPIQISFWGTSYNLISTAQSLYSPITNSLFPHMVGNKDVKVVKRILIILMPAIVICSMVCFIFAKQIITTVCGEEYINSVSIFKMLIPVLLFSFPAMLLGFPLLGSFGYTQKVTLTTVFAAFFHIVGIVLLFAIKKFTINNIAILRSMTELFLLVLRVIYCKKYQLL